MRPVVLLFLDFCVLFLRIIMYVEYLYINSVVYIVYVHMSVNCSYVHVHNIIITLIRGKYQGIFIYHLIIISNIYSSY